MRKLAALAAMASLISTTAHAGAVLIATGSISGSAAGPGVDLSGLSYPLENGNPQNILGGLGSGLAYGGGTTFYATPDRGPNALVYNAAIDSTTSFISRFQTLNLQLTASNAGSALPFTLTSTLTNTTLLYSPSQLNYGSGAGLGNTSSGAPLPNGNWVNSGGKNYFTGRSDNYGAGNSGNPLDARFDPESIRMSNDGKSVFISDEYGPYVRQFDSKTGELIRTYDVPHELYVSNLSPSGDAEISGNTVGRTANKGMEGLAITPDGKTLVGVMQANLVNDPSGTVRLVTIDVASGETHEYAYKLSIGSGISDIVAIDATHFLVDERDGKGLGDLDKNGNSSNAKNKQLIEIDLSGATDVKGVVDLSTVTDLKYAQNQGAFVDVVAALKGLGLSANQIPSKIEGIAFGQDVVDANGDTLHTLFVANDNDFDVASSGENEFYVFGFKDSDLPGFTQQAVSAPEPASWALLIAGFGFVGGMLRLRRRKALQPA